MAMASRWMGARFNRPDFQMIEYDVYALCGDGCMMEGISGEAASLAGHLKLSNLCWIYDSNKITIEGRTDLAFTEDVATRFLAYDWNVTRVSDANDGDASPRVRSSEHHRPAHADHRGQPSLTGALKDPCGPGEPLGEEEIRLTKRNYGWPEDAKFLVPDEVRAHFRNGMAKRGTELRQLWMAKFKEFEKLHAQLSDHLYKMQHRQLPDGWDKELPVFPADAKGMATRDSSGKVLNALAKNLPWIIGGSADLAPSTKTRLTFDGAGDFSAENYHGRISFGIRNMHASIMNGLALSKVRPYGSGLIFSDYARPAIRLAA